MTSPRRVIFRCDTCTRRNQQDEGVLGPDYLLQETFDSLTEAWRHMMEQPNSLHYIYAEEED